MGACRMDAQSFPQHRTQTEPVRLACLGEHARQRDVRFSPWQDSIEDGGGEKLFIFTRRTLSDPLRVRQQTVEPKEATTQA